jgi:hypothetical protein
MAGSLDTFVYSSDTGQEFLVRLDKTNAIAGGFALAVPSNITLPALPNRIKMRVVNCRSASGVTRRIAVGSVGSDIWKGIKRQVDLFIITGDTAKAYPFTISSRVGEKERYVILGESGQTDAPGSGTTPPA